VAVLELNKFVTGLPEKTQSVFGYSIFRVKLDAASVRVFLGRRYDGKLLYGFNFSNSLQEIPECRFFQFQLAAIGQVLPMTSAAGPEYVAWRGISERGLGNDLRDFPLKVMSPLMGNAGDDGISGGGEGDKDDSIIDSAHAGTEMGQTIDSDLGQGSHVHREKVAIFRPEGK
jgi:hypothetical protein